MTKLNPVYGVASRSYPAPYHPYSGEYNIPSAPPQSYSYRWISDLNLVFRHFWCMCGEKKALLGYKQITLDCTGAQCREKLVGKASPPDRLYFKCRACPNYYTDQGYEDVPQPCSLCPAKVWPTPVPEFQHYLCKRCWMYFTLRSGDVYLFILLMLPATIYTAFLKKAHIFVEFDQ